MKEKLINFLKGLLRTYLKRDILIIKADWPVKRTANNIFISKIKEGSSYLPVRYNYHTNEAWELCYEICGNSHGQLNYSLKLSDGTRVWEIEKLVNLPYSLQISRKDGILCVNGEKHPIYEINTKNPNWLIANFTYKTSTNTIMQRTVGHQVIKKALGSDTEYYYGDVYQNYEEQAARFPEEILKKVEKYHPITGKLLDVGCATGLLVERALSLGLDAEGVDISGWAIEQANIKTNGRCRVLEFDRAYFSDFSSLYDIITLHSVIEHFERPEAAMQLLYEICRPGGVVYIQTLNSESLMHLIRKSDWDGYSDITHKSPWISASWILQTATELGFKIAYIHRHHVWNDNIYDDVWKEFTSIFQVYPLNILLEEQLGDVVEVILIHS